MTEPAPPLPEVSTFDALFFVPATTTFCTACQIHLATTLRPLCPVCLDLEKRAER